MKKQNYAARGFLFIALSLTTLTLAFAEETITITTYYPSPYGSYYNLTASNNVTLANVTGSRVGIGTATPGAKLDVRGQIIGGFGAATTGGTTNWNDVTNARSGSGYTLLYGTAANGMGGSYYYHPFSFEYSSKDGTGNMYQLAIPYYAAYANDGDVPWYRSRYSGSWTPWRRFLVENYNGNVGIGITSPELKLTVTGRSGAYGAALFRNAAYANTFSILPHPGITYLSSGIYYNGGWIQANDNNYNQLFAMDTPAGARWYASSTGTGSWNLASAVLLWNNSGTWVGSSSRTLKENFTRLNPDDILQKIDQLDLTRWNFKAEGKSITHIGPVAEDFYRIFKTGDAENHLATIDTAGVSLVGVKALFHKVKTQQQQIDKLQQEIENLKTELINLKNNL